MKRKLIEKKVHKYKGGLTKRALILTSLFLALIAVSGVTIYALAPQRTSKQPAPLPTPLPASTPNAFVTQHSNTLSSFMYLEYEDKFEDISKRRDVGMNANICGEIFGIILYQTLDIKATNPNEFQILINKIKVAIEQLSEEKAKEELLIEDKVHVIKLFSDVLLGFKTVFSLLMRMRKSVEKTRISGSFFYDIDVILTYYSILQGIYKVKEIWTSIVNDNLAELFYDKNQEEKEKELPAVKGKIDYIFAHLLPSNGRKCTIFHTINNQNFNISVELREMKKHKLYGLVFDYYLYILIHLIFDGLYQTDETESSESKYFNITVKEELFKEELKDKNNPESLAKAIENIREAVLVFKKLKELEEGKLFEEKSVFPSDKEFRILGKFESSVFKVLELCEKSWKN